MEKVIKKQYKTFSEVIATPLKRQPFESSDTLIKDEIYTIVVDREYCIFKYKGAGRLSNGRLDKNRVGCEMLHYRQQYVSLKTNTDKNNNYTSAIYISGRRMRLATKDERDWLNNSLKEKRVTDYSLLRPLTPETEILNTIRKEIGL